MKKNIFLLLILILFSCLPPQVNNFSIIGISTVPAKTTVAYGEVLEISVQISTTEGQSPLTYAWTATAGTITDPAKQSITWTAPTANLTAVISVTVSDAKGRTETQELSLTVLQEAVAPAGSYELVLRINARGEVLEGSWDNAYDKVVNRMADCMLRFDDRLAVPLYIEYDTYYMRFDFQNLNGWHSVNNTYGDAYAYVHIEPGVKAGLGTALRKGHPDEIWKKDSAQLPDYNAQGCEVSLYCERENGFVHTATVNSAGTPVYGTWTDLWDKVVNKTARCKLKADGRIFMPPHIDYDEATAAINFDMLGLNATYDQSYYADAYVYINFTLNTRAGLGTSFRHGMDEHIYYKDKDLREVAGCHEYQWKPYQVALYCEDLYDKEISFNAAGVITGGSWQEFYTLVVDQGADCMVKYDSRISIPQYIEYTSDSFRFEFANLHAWHNGDAYTHDLDCFAFAYINNSAAGLNRNYRNGNWNEIWKKSVLQHVDYTPTNMPLTIRIKSGSAYHNSITVATNGAANTLQYQDFYQKLTDNSIARLYKVRGDGRILTPLLVEYTAGDNTKPLYFAYNSLSACTYSLVEAYALSIVQLNAPTGIAGSYMYGHIDTTHPFVSERLSIQYPTPTAVQPFDTDILFR